MENFHHTALSLKNNMPLVYTAMSKHSFYLRFHISQYVLQQGKTPLNPFLLFDYFLLDTVDRNVIRQANNSLVSAAQEIWVFGPISDGVYAEIQMAKKQEKNTSFFSIEHGIIPISEEEALFEESLL